MRKFTQAVIVLTGFSAAVVAVKAEQAKPAVGNCYEIKAPTAPTVCNWANSGSGSFPPEAAIGGQIVAKKERAPGGRPLKFGRAVA